MKKSYLLIAFLVGLLLLAACQPEAEQVEVTRIVTETLTEEIEVTRVVEERLNPVVRIDLEGRVQREEHARIEGRTEDPLLDNLRLPTVAIP